LSYAPALWLDLLTTEAAGLPTELILPCRGRSGDLPR